MQAYIILQCCWIGEKGDGLKFIMWLELFPFVETFIVEINGLYVVFVSFSLQPWVLQSPIIFFPKLQLLRLQIMWSITAGPGMSPTHNHLSCVLIPAMIKPLYSQEGLTALLFKMSPINRTGMSLPVLWLVPLHIFYVSFS